MQNHPLHRIPYPRFRPAYRFIYGIGFRYILCIGILTARIILTVIVTVLCMRFRPGFIDRLSHRTAAALLFCGLLDLNDLCRSGFCLDRGLRFRRHIAFRIPGPTGLPYRIRQAIRRRGFNLFGRSAAGFRSRRIRAVIYTAERSDSLEEPILPEDAGADTEVPDPELPAPLPELLPELPEARNCPYQKRVPVSQHWLS